MYKTKCKHYKGINANAQKFTIVNAGYTTLPHFVTRYTDVKKQMYGWSTLSDSVANICPEEDQKHDDDDEEYLPE